jgi:hypothetical protein
MLSASIAYGKLLSVERVRQNNNLNVADIELKPIDASERFNQKKNERQKIDRKPLRKDRSSHVHRTQEIATALTNLEL